MPFRAEILEFVRTFTVYVEGVGHVCSFALFDFARHGDVRYGAPVDAPKSQRSRDGKMEQAYLNFKSQHPTWRANDDAGDAGDALLHNISTGDRLAASRHAAAAHAHAAAAPPPPPRRARRRPTSTAAAAAAQERHERGRAEHARAARPRRRAWRRARPRSAGWAARRSAQVRSRRRSSSSCAIVAASPPTPAPTRSPR